MYEAQSMAGGRQQQGSSPQNKGGAQAGGRSGRAPVPLRPVTIRMVLDAQRVGDGALTISGNEVGNVTVAGRIVDVSVDAKEGAAPSHTYKITDGSGVLTVKHWIDQNAGTATAMELGCFIAATGNIKVYQERPTLNGSVRLLADVNEFTLHMLESLNVHLRMVEGDKMPAGAKQKGADGATAPATAAAGQQQGMLQGMPTAPAGSSNLVDVIQGMLNMHQHKRIDGIDAAYMLPFVVNAGHHVTEVEVANALQGLSNAGLMVAHATAPGRFTF